MDDARLVKEYEETGMLIGRDPPWYDDNLIQRVKSKGQLQNLHENLR